MANTAEDDLKNILANGNALIVCGAGVSAGLTGGQAPGWKALVEKSVAYCKAQTVLTASDEEDFERWLKAGTVTEQWLKAAELVRRQVGARFRTFLGGELDGLSNTSPVLTGQLKSFLDAGNAIATTNYDNLLAAALGVRPVTWVHPVEAMQIVKGQAKNVLHLHGHWTEPESVVFSETDYQKVMQAEDSQFVQKLAIHNRSLVFMGCSLDGLSDFNIGNLMNWFHTSWKDLGEKHYVLCLEKDKSGWPDAVTKVVYGNTHADLAPFLQKLVPPRRDAIHLESPPEMIGRQQELRQVVDWVLGDRHPVIIPGMPGMGKSALALEVAHHDEVKTKFAKQRYFLRLDAAGDASAMVNAVARRLGFQPSGNASNTADMIAANCTSPTLLVLDNLESPWHNNRPEVEDAITRMASGRHLQLILTIRGETPNLVRDSHKLDDIAKLNEADATALFLRGLPEKFRQDVDLQELIKLLDGHPLSITLMRAQVDAEPNLVALLKRWNAEAAGMMKKNTGDQSLNNLIISVTLSFEKLSPEAKRLARLVARLPAGLALWMAQDILGEVLANTAARELKKARLATIEGERLTMLSPLRAAVLALSKANKHDENQLRLSLLAIAGKADEALQGMSDAEKSEIDNLETAINWAVLEVDDTGLVEAVWGFSTLHRMNGLGSVSAILKAADYFKKGNKIWELAQAEFCLGNISSDKSERKDAEARFLSARGRYKSIGHELGMAQCYLAQAVISLRKGELKLTSELLDQAQVLFHKIGSIIGQIQSLLMLGDVFLRENPI
jgi:SIR2-like domain/NB-ARC domain